MKEKSYEIKCRRKCILLMGLLSGNEKFTLAEVKDIADTVAEIKQLSTNYVMENLKD